MKPGSGEVSVRRATVNDADLLRTWRNDAAVRCASRQTTFVKVDEHLAWLTGVLAERDRHLLVAESNGSPVGQVRFDRVGQSTFEISVSVAVRGRGLGSAAIAAGVRWLAETEGPTLIEAHVRSDNGASARAFESAGFSEGQPTEDGFRRLIVRVDFPYS